MFSRSSPGDGGGDERRLAVPPVCTRDERVPRRSGDPDPLRVDEGERLEVVDAPPRRHAVPAMLRKKGRLSEEFHSRPIHWRNPGFSADGSTSVARGDRKARASPERDLWSATHPSCVASRARSRAAHNRYGPARSAGRGSSATFSGPLCPFHVSPISRAPRRSSTGASSTHRATPASRSSVTSARGIHPVGLRLPRPTRAAASSTTSTVRTRTSPKTPECNPEARSLGGSRSDSAKRVWGEVPGCLFNPVPAVPLPPSPPRGLPALPPRRPSAAPGASQERPTLPPGPPYPGPGSGDWVEISYPYPST